MFDEPGVLLQRGAKKGLTRQEHHHKFRSGFELLPIVLAAEASSFDVADLPGMVSLDALRRDILVGSFESFQKRL